MEILSQIWVWLGTAVGGLTIGGIIASIVYGCLKGAFNKTISKINVDKISKEAVDKGIDKVKSISFSQSIQPVVESGLKKVTEEANKYIEEQLVEVQKKYDKLVNVIEKFSALFDNSFSIPAEAREELKTAIEEAKDEPASEQIIEVEEIAEEKPTKVVEAVKIEDKATKVER